MILGLGMILTRSVSSEFENYNAVLKIRIDLWWHPTVTLFRQNLGIRGPEMVPRHIFSVSTPPKYPPYAPRAV